MTAHAALAGVEINAKPSGRQAEILSAEALTFIAGLLFAAVNGPGRILALPWTLMPDPALGRRS